MTRCHQCKQVVSYIHLSRQIRSGDNTMTDKLLSFPQVKDLTGLSRTTIWRYEQSNHFPQHITLSKRCIRWRESEVMAWMNGLNERVLIS